MLFPQNTEANQTNLIRQPKNIQIITNNNYQITRIFYKIMFETIHPCGFNILYFLTLTVTIWQYLTTFPKQLYRVKDTILEQTNNHIAMPILKYWLTMWHDDNTVSSH